MRGALRGLLSTMLALASCAAVAAVPQPPLDIPTPYLPSTNVAVEEMLRIADVGPKDVVVDLGSGDGRIVIAAAAVLGARGFGVDIDGKLVAEANDNARRAGVADRAKFFERDVFATDVREATVVTMYLLPSLVNRLKPKLLKELAPGTRIVAHDYGFDTWKPDRTATISKNYYLYIVPAHVAGKWQLEATLGGEAKTLEMELKQDHQVIGGGARTAGGFLPLFEPRLEGTRVRFALVDGGRAYHFDGRVEGSQIEGTVTAGLGNSATRSRFRAVRMLPGAE